MRDPEDDQGIDRAYRAAVDLVGSGGDQAKVDLRRHAVLEAVHAARAPAAQEPRPDAAVTSAPPHESHPAASNEPQWRRPAAWWGAAMAACMMAGSTLLVVHLLEEPGTGVSGTVADARPPQTVALAPTAAAPSPASTLSANASLAPVPSAANEVQRAADAAMAKVAQSREERAQAARKAEPEANAVSERSVPAPVAVPMPAQTTAPLARTDASRGADASTATAPAARVAALEKAAPQAQTSQAGTAAKTASADTAPQQADLLAAVAAGTVDGARRILARTGPDSDRDADGRTALALAVLRSDAPMVGLLLEHGANRLTPDRFGQTPLGYAVTRGDPAVMKAFGLK